MNQNVQGSSADPQSINTKALNKKISIVILNHPSDLLIDRETPAN